MPKPGPQAAAWVSDADELFFGGIAGSGKSDLLLGLALYAHRKSLILRRESTQLKEIVARAQELVTSADRWRGSGYGGLITTRSGRTVEMTGCPNEKDKHRFKGRAHDLKSWDEVVDFPESVYLFVNAWNRSAVPGQRCRVVCASNPPTTPEGEWVIRRWRAWLDPMADHKALPGELVWYARIDGSEKRVESGQPFRYKGETITPKSRTFIPGVMVRELRDAGYIATLQSLPEPLRSIYLRGDFSAAKRDHAWQLIPSRWVMLAQQRWQERAATFGIVGKPTMPMTALGCDVAMGGEDNVVFAPNYYRWVAPLRVVPGSEVPTGQAMLGLILRETAEFPACIVNMDVTGGFGKSAYDLTQATAVPLRNIRPLVSSASAPDGFTDRSEMLRFSNLRAAIWWNLREQLDPEGGEPETRLALPPDPILAADLTAVRWRVLANSTVQIEPKDGDSPDWGLIKRLGRSPDRGDAVAYAAWQEPEKPGLVFSRTKKR